MGTVYLNIIMCRGILIFRTCSYCLCWNSKWQTNEQNDCIQYKRILLYRIISEKQTEHNNEHFNVIIQNEVRRQGT